MIRKMCVIACLCFFFMNFSAFGLIGDAETAIDEEGLVLLNSLRGGFREMAEKSTGGYELVNDLIQKKMAELKKAEAEKKLNPVFLKRYKRILVVIKLTIMETSYDPEGILESLILDEQKKFIKDVTGEDKELQISTRGGIGSISGALSKEISNLYIYLDSRKN
jgi:hypothetical protein